MMPTRRRERHEQFPDKDLDQQLRPLEMPISGAITAFFSSKRSGVNARKHPQLFPQTQNVEFEFFLDRFSIGEVA